MGKVDVQHTVAVEAWLAELASALATGTPGDVRRLFVEDCYWRDAVALTWTLTTVSGLDEVADALTAAAGERGFTGLHVDLERTAPRLVTRAGTPCIEAFIRFDTVVGRGDGIVRLIAADDGRVEGWTILTALDELKGHEEHTGANRPTGQSHARDFRGPNWLDLRRKSASYDDRDPAVLVVGGGQAGISIAARLNNLGVDTLVIDRHQRVGDCWRKRYHALTLHNQVQVNHLPYMPYPPNWPTYIPKDKVASWFEAYVEAMEINYWTGAELVSGSYDRAKGKWSATVRHSDGRETTLHPRHLVMATGVSGIANRPDIATLDRFEGIVQHSSEYQDGEDWSGKSAIVIGTGNSGHDIAHDLASSGARVTLVQRSPTLIVNLEPSAQFPYVLYDEGPPLEDCDLITVAMPAPLMRKAHIAFTERARLEDKPLLDKLEKKGFKLNFGEDGSGWQFMYLTRGGGYYFNVGCSNMIVDGLVDLAQFADIEEFVAGGAVQSDGRKVPADLIVLATGYRPWQELVARLLGRDIADKVGPIWGFGDGLELRNMYCRTPQPGLWFIAGSFAQCRINSKYLALQIKASELGLA